MTSEEKERHEIAFDIKEHIGVISSYNNGWTKELNLVAWNSANPKYDIRDWDQDHVRMSKGITLHPEEMAVLKDLIVDRSV